MGFLLFICGGDPRFMHTVLGKLCWGMVSHVPKALIMAVFTCDSQSAWKPKCGSEEPFPSSVVCASCLPLCRMTLSVDRRWWLALRQHLVIPQPTFSQEDQQLGPDQ